MPPSHLLKTYHHRELYLIMVSLPPISQDRQQGSTQTKFTLRWGQIEVKRSSSHKLVNTRGTGIGILLNQMIMMWLSQVEAIRKSGDISQSVARILNHYEESEKQQTLQGKGHSGKKSERFNTMETCTAPPELRWPNEGFVGGTNRKRLSYDDMSIPQWVAGQLNNISQIQDNSLLRLVLDQVIAAMRDASSLPWVAVRGAWVSSMHDMEEGRLTWRDTTQWAINRLSNAQVAMLNSQAVSQTKGRVCRYYNEGACSFDGHHGLYKHFCSYCFRQGKSNNHPESRCQLKNNGRDRQQTQ